MIERKTVSQCVLEDYCKGWNDAVDKMPKWISVKDAQPSKGVNVLFHPMCNPDSIYIGCINHVGEKGACYFEVRRGKYKTQYSATHWMPLPEPPKGGCT